MTTTSTPTLPPAWNTLQTALHQRRPVEITYHGRRRTICPHALGWNTHARALLLAYQSGGQTSTGTLHPDPRQRWRCLYIDEIETITTTDPTSPWQSADNYNPAHPFPHIHNVTIAVTTAGPR